MFQKNREILSGTFHSSIVCILILKYVFNRKWWYKTVYYTYISINFTQLKIFIFFTNICYSQLLHNSSKFLFPFFVGTWEGDCKHFGSKGGIALWYSYSNLIQILKFEISTSSKKENPRNINIGHIVRLSFSNTDMQQLKKKHFCPSKHANIEG